MKRLFLITALCVSSFAQSGISTIGGKAVAGGKVVLGSTGAIVPTPNFVQGRSSQISANSGTPTALGTQSNGSGTGFCATLTYCLYFAQNVGANNLTTVYVEYASSPATTFTITNDQGDSYSSGAVTAAASSKLGQAFYKCGTTAGAREIKIAVSTGVIIDHVFIGEYNNVATSSCLDTSNNNTGASGTTLTAGSVTPGVSGELIVNDGCAAGTPARTSFTVGSQANIAWAKRGSDISDGCAEQWGVYNATAAINPTFTTAPASTFLATSMVFKAANAGTAPSGIYIVYYATYDMLSANSAFKLEFPSTGNLLFMNTTGDITTNEVPVICITGQANCSATGITDATNTWTTTFSGVNVNSGPDYWASLNGGVFGPFNQNTAWYAKNTAADTSGAMTINQPSTGGSATSQFVFYDIANADTTNPLLTRYYHAGDQANGAAINAVPNFFPGSANSLVISTLGQFQNTSTSLSAPTGVSFQSSTFGGQDLNGPSQPDENNMLGSLINTSASSQTWTDVMISAAANVGGWSSETDSFLASGGTRSGPSYTALSTAQGTASATLAITIPSTVSGDSLVAVIGSFNSTGRTVSSVCLDGTTCAAGNVFTQAASAACTNSGNRGDIWYLLAPNTGKTTVTVTYSASASNTEAGVYTVRNISTFDLANNASTQTGSGSVNTGVSITSTGAPGFLVSITATSGGTVVNPSSGNEYGYGGAIFSNTTDAFNSLIAAAAAHHFDTRDSSAIAGFCNSAAAFK